MPRKAAWGLVAAYCLIAAYGLSGCLDTTKPSESTAEYRMRGDFRKGPFASKSVVRVSMLDKHGEPSGRNYETATENDSGDFHLTVSGGTAEFSATGKYYDEASGMMSGAELRLLAVAQVPEDGKTPVHVNGFTHIAGSRAKKLMSLGRKPADAIAQAEKELRTELGIANSEGSKPYAGATLDLLGGNNPHTLYLLTLSSILGQAALQKAGGHPELAERQMQAVLDSLASDLADDGKLGGNDKAVLAAAEKAVDPVAVRKGLEAWAKAHNSNVVFPDLSKSVDTDKNGKPNDQDPDDDGDHVADDLDCAPLDSSRQMVSPDGQRCVAIYPPAPLLGSADDKQAKLIWDDMPGAPRYTLWYSQGDIFDSSAAREIEGAQPGEVVSGLENGKAYSFKVSALYGDLPSPLSPQVRLVPVGIASGFTGVAGTGKVTLAWSAAEGASSYTLYFRSGSGVDRNDNKVTNVVSPYVLTTLQDGKPYSFALASVSDGSESRLSDTISATPIQIPGHVKLVSGDKMLVVSWDSAAGAAAYDVYYAPGDTVGADGGKRTGRASPDTVRGLDNGSRYAVRVRATAAPGSSDLSAGAWSVPLGAASGASAQAGTGRVTLDWKPGAGASAYSIYYWTGKDSPARITVSNPPAILKGLKNGVTYSMRVISANGGIEASAGDTLSSTPLAIPDSAVALMQDGGVSLSWAPVPGAAGYSVFYGEGTIADTNAAHLSVKEPKLALGGLSNDVYYAMIIRAENGNGHSDPGNTVRAMPMKAVTGFSAMAETDKVTLRWDPASGAATRYNVYYRKGDAVDKAAQQIANAQPGQIVTGLQNGELYTFAVEVVKGEYAGPLSDAKSAIYISSTLQVGSGAASDSVASYLSLAVDANDKPYLAYVDQGKTLAERNLPVVVTLGKDGWIALPRPSAKSPYTCCELRIGPGEMPYLGFGDAEKGNRISVKAYDGSGWSSVGNTPVTDNKAEFMAMGIDALGVPYVAYNDSAQAGHVSARRLAGSKWSQVGLPGFSTNAAGPLSIAFTRTGLPLLSSGATGSVAASVMAFDGKNWGAAGDVTGMLSRAAPGPLPLGVTPGNLAYAAMVDRMTGYKVSVLANSGSAWNAVGQPGFGDGSTQEVALASDPNGIPYVAFADDSKAGKVSVMKYANGSWTYACRAGFSQGRASFVRIAVSHAGTVYVAYQDAGLGGRAQVVKLNAP